MKLINALAVDYWLEHTNKIYKENLHVSTPVMEAYEAGFKMAKELALSMLIHELGEADSLTEELRALGEDEENV